MEKVCGIYCIENLVNHKVYIGSSKDIHKRWYSHRYCLVNKKHNNSYLQAAYSKYGESNFKFYILECCEIAELSNREEFYIRSLQSYLRDFGYNLESAIAGRKLVATETRIKISAAGKGRRKSTETRAKMSVAQRGKYVSPETRIKLRAANIGKSASVETRAKMSAAQTGINNHFYGKTHSAETRTKISLALRSGKRVAQIDGTGKYIAVWDIADAVSVFSKQVRKVVNRPGRTHKGFAWKYIEDVSNGTL